MFCTIILAKGSNTKPKNWYFQKKLNEPKTCMSLKIEFLGRGRVPEKNKMCSGKLSQFLIWLTKLFSANQSLRSLKSTPLGFPINPPRLYFTITTLIRLSHWRHVNLIQRWKKSKVFLATLGMDLKLSAKTRKSANGF